MEAADIWGTNPLFLTNSDAALSPKGVQQVQDTCEVMRREGIAPSVVRYSFAAACLNTASIISSELQVTQDRLIPEFFFLDPRAIGQWNKQPLSTTEPAVWALDVDEAQYDGRGGRPPANDDSTPNESLGDHAIRLRQLFSACETVYSGDTVILVFPDGTGPALLSCMIAGIPFDRAHELELRNGELRRDVTFETTRQLLQERQSQPDFQTAYRTKIDEGRKELKRLRSIDFVQQQSDEMMRAGEVGDSDNHSPSSDQPVAAIPTQSAPKESKPTPSRATSMKLEKSTRKLDSKNQEAWQTVTSQDKVPEAPESLQTSQDGKAVTLGALGVVGVLAAANSGEADDANIREFTTAMELSGDINREDLMTKSNPNSAMLDTPMGSNNAEDTLAAEKDVSPLGDFPGDPSLWNAPTVGTKKGTLGVPTSDENILCESESDTTVLDLANVKDEDGKTTAAARAMEHYLDEDDGGDAWLQSLSDIIIDSEPQDFGQDK